MSGGGVKSFNNISWRSRRGVGDKPMSCKPDYNMSVHERSGETLKMRKLILVVAHGISAKSHVPTHIYMYIYTSSIFGPVDETF